MKKYLLFVFAVATVTFSANAQTVTFSQQVAPIIYNHCTNCHRPGEIAPFSLTNYNEVKSWGGMIQYTTGIKYMPPWKAEEGYQNYQHQNYLTTAEIQTLSDWVDQGMVQGDPNQEPPLPVFPTGSQVGTPDLVVSFAQSYTHVGNNVDEYRYFAIPTGLTQDTDLIALELRPGNKKIVHHCLVWGDTTGQAMADDAATPEYGYESGTGSAAAGLNNQLPGYVPGQKPILYTNGIGMRLRAGTDLKLQMHYAPSSTDETDSSTINLFFAHQPVTRYVKSYVMLPLPSVLTNGPFIIQANTVKKFHGTWTVPEDVSMLGIAPHMHLLGQNWEVFAVKPNGDTVNLVKINEWDFNWQGTYNFKSLIHLPQGTVIHASAEYDNTSNNIHNPHNPPQTISWGEKTSDEMYYLPLIYLSYQQGDENVVFDDATGIADNKYYTVKDALYPIAPNPASDVVKAGFTIAEGTNLTLKLYNLNGQVVTTIADNQYYLPGLHTTEINVAQLPAGFYTLALDTKDKHQVQKLVVTH